MAAIAAPEAQVARYLADSTASFIDGDDAIAGHIVHSLISTPSNK
jgi:hypothetical protein